MKIEVQKVSLKQLEKLEIGDIFRVDGDGTKYWVVARDREGTVAYFGLHDAKLQNAPHFPTNVVLVSGRFIIEE